MSPFILEIQNGKYKGRRVRITEGEVVVGRDETAKIRIASDEVSRLHCKLVILEQGLEVHDLQSKNGTFVNGKPISSPQLIKVGDTLTIGPMILKLIGDDLTAPRKPASLKTRPAKPGVDQGLSDDDIASLLSDDAIPVSTQDTTIIPVAAELAKAKPPAEGDSTIRRRAFKSVAEEAQDIIRRHLESLASSP